MLANKTIRLFLALTFVRQLGFTFTSATYVTFLLSHDLSLFEVNLVNFCFFTTMFLTEIPTGAIADVYGRRVSYLLACLLTGLGMTLYGFSSSLWWFIAAEIIVGIGVTFETGAFRAWCVDQVNHHGNAPSTTKLFKAADQVKQVSMILGGLIGAVIAEGNLAFPWFLAAGAIFASGVIAFVWMREDYRANEKKGERNGIIKTILASAHFARESKAFRFLALMSIVQFVVVQAPNMFWQPFFKNAVPGQSGLGLLFVGMALALMLGAQLAEPLLIRLKRNETRAILISQSVIGAGLIGTAIAITPLLAIPFFLVHEVARGMFNPLKDAYLHDSIPSRERATLDSFLSIVNHIGAMVGLLIMGLLADRTSIAVSWFVSGAILIASVVAFLRTGWKR